MKLIPYAGKPVRITRNGYKIGRPRAAEPYTCTNVGLYARHYAWLGARNRSEVIRRLIDDAIEREGLRQEGCEHGISGEGWGGVVY